MEHLLINLLGKTRRASLHGREHIVAPLSLIVPGVLNGSKGALYYPPEEIGRDPSIWNHVPLVVYHPNVGGQNVSARDPDVLNSHGIGIILKTKVDNKGRLVAEGWFDVERCRKVDNRVLQSLEAGKAIELSTGLFTDNHPAPQGSVHNGRSYQYIARNYRPDHLAILPDQKGACSLDDGCGVMVNAKGDDEGQWITMGGTHVLIKGGEVISGPKALKEVVKKGGGNASKDKAARTARYAKRDARHEREAQRDIKRGDKVVGLGSGATKKPAPAAKPAEKKSLLSRLGSAAKGLAKYGAGKVIQKVKRGITASPRGTAKRLGDMSGKVIGAVVAEKAGKIAGKIVGFVSGRAARYAFGSHGLGFNSALGSGRLIANAEQRDDDGKFTGQTADSAGSIPAPKNKQLKKAKKSVKAAAGDSAEAQSKIEQVGNLMILGSGTVNGGPGSGPRKGGGEDTAKWMQSPEGKKALATRSRIVNETKDSAAHARRMGNLAEAKDLEREASRVAGTNLRDFVDNATTNSRLYDCEEDCDDDEDCIDDCLENNVESIANGGPGSGPRKGGGAGLPPETAGEYRSANGKSIKFGDVVFHPDKGRGKAGAMLATAKGKRVGVMWDDTETSSSHHPSELEHGGKVREGSPRHRLASNASVHQQKCQESGKFLRLGAGNGKGENHTAARAGAGVVALPDSDDPWESEGEVEVSEECNCGGTCEECKASAEAENASVSPLTNKGGREMPLTKKQRSQAEVENANPEGCNQYKSCGAGGGGAGGDGGGKAPKEEAKTDWSQHIGKSVHMGFGTKGGAGYVGKLKKIDE